MIKKEKGKIENMDIFNVLTMIGDALKADSMIAGIDSDRPIWD